MGNCSLSSKSWLQNPFKHLDMRAEWPKNKTWHAPRVQAQPVHPRCQNETQCLRNVLKATCVWRRWCINLPMLWSYRSTRICAANRKYKDSASIYRIRKNKSKAKINLSLHLKNKSLCLKPRGFPGANTKIKWRLSGSALRADRSIIVIKDINLIDSSKITDTMITSKLNNAINRTWWAMQM